MSKLEDIQKDVILFFIILVFLACFYYWWGFSKEEFDINTWMNQPVSGLIVPSSWTNSKINGSNIEVQWSNLTFDTNELANPSKNSEFSLSFWLFLGDPKSKSLPIFRIIDFPHTNSPGIPGIWLTRDNIQIKNHTSSKSMQMTRIPLQSLDFYTFVFTAYDYSIYINSELMTNEKWDAKPAAIKDTTSAYLEIATAATENHYVIKDVKVYNELFIPETVVKLYDLTKDVGNEINEVIDIIGGLPVINESDWVYLPTLDTYHTIKTYDLIGNWSSTNIASSATMSISFWINISENNPNWRCIFHVSNQNLNCCSVGNRVPAMWIYPGSTNVHFRHSTSNEGNAGPYIDSYQVPMNTPTFITIVINSTNIAFYENGKQVGSTHEFSTPLIAADGTASFYMADPWYAFGGFQIKNFRLYNNVFTSNDVLDLYSSESVVK